MTAETETLDIRPYITIACGHCGVDLAFTGDGYECRRCQLFFPGDDEDGRYIDPTVAPCGRTRPPATMIREDRKVRIDYAPCDLPITHESDHHLVGTSTDA